MKKVTKKLLISVMILMVAASLAITSTYAWFTMNDTPEVSGFDLQVTSVDGLYISLTPADGDDSVGADGTFKSYLTVDEINAELLRVFESSEEGVLKSLTHGTSADGVTVAPIDDVAGVRDEETAFYSFRIYFRSNNAYQVKLNLENEVEDEVETGRLRSYVETKTASTLPAVKAWTTTPFAGYAEAFEGDTQTGTFAVGDDMVARAANAVRIAFGGKIWDPNEGKGFADTQAGNAAFQYYNHVNVDKLTYTAPAAATVDANTVLVELTGDATTGYNGYIDVVIWLEGWDGNAFNSVLGELFTTRLVFQGELLD